MSYKTAASEFINLTKLKVGDTVKVTHKVKSYSHGWPSSWNDKMSEMVGEEYKVIDIVSGEVLLSNYYFPFFVIDIVEQPVLPSPMKLTTDYLAIFNNDKSITVNKIVISFDTLEAIYKAAKSINL